MKREEPLDLSLFELSISSHAKFLNESWFVGSPESLNPNELIESRISTIDSEIVNNNIPLQVYTRRKRQIDQTSQLQSAPHVTSISQCYGYECCKLNKSSWISFSKERGKSSKFIITLQCLC